MSSRKIVLTAIFGVLSFGSTFTHAGVVQCDIEVKTSHDRTCRYVYGGQVRNPFTNRTLTLYPERAVLTTNSEDLAMYRKDGVEEIVRVYDPNVFGNWRDIVVLVPDEYSLDVNNYNPTGEPKNCPTLTGSRTSTKTFLNWVPTHTDSNGTVIVGHHEREDVEYTIFPSLTSNVEIASNVVSAISKGCSEGIAVGGRRIPSHKREIFEP